MPANSRQVSSNQRHIHANLATVVDRHLGAPYRRPPAQHSVTAYAQLQQRLNDSELPLILDSFCGTGHSTAALAQCYPEHLVVGIDKSGQRLARHRAQACDNYLLLQADCEDIWQLLVRDGHRCIRHFLFYPNPWPKARHLQRRVHGHGSFPLLLQLGGDIMLRSNWQIYVEEFGVAMHLAGRAGKVGRVPDGPAMTLFEQKYRGSGHPLWQFTAAAPAVTC